MRLSQDVRSAFRLLLKRPGFSVVVILTLAIGIGLNTAVFSTVDTLLLRPLPGVRNADELVQAYRSYPGNLYGTNSFPHLRDVTEGSRDVFSGVAGWSFMTMSLSIPRGQPQLIFGMVVSGNYFDLLGVHAVRGRTLLPEDDQRGGGHPYAVLSYGAWQGIFGGDPAIVERSIVLDGQPYTVVGVAPREFKGSIRIAEPTLWVPLGQMGQLSPRYRTLFDTRDYNLLDIVARLKPGVSFAQADQRMQALLTGLKETYPASYRDNGIQLVRQADAGIHPRLRNAQIGLTAVVMAVVVTLLLIACVNVANLFLARARDRAREMAIRIALGAGRGALVRQLLTESLVIAAVSGIAGLALAMWVMSVVNRVSPPLDVTISAGLSISPLVLAFTCAVSVGTTLLFGLAPALRATRPDLVPALKGASSDGNARSRVSRGLVVAQMALSLVLLVCAGLFIHDLKRETQADKGFASDHLLVARLAPELQGYERGRSRAFYQQLSAQLSARPGVKQVAFASTLPLGPGTPDDDVDVPGYVPAPNEPRGVEWAAVTPGYFEAMKIPLLEGRAFTEQDDSAAAHVIVVNHTFAQRYWPGQSALGKIVRIDSADVSYLGSREARVIGVVPTGKYNRLGEDPTPFMYFPHEQHWERTMTAVVRTAGDPAAFAPLLRAEVGALDRNMPISDVESMEGFLGFALLPSRLVGTTLGVFGLLGLLLASVGIYGVMAYSVSQRTRELGIRMAIGAAVRDVTTLVLREGLTLALIGMGIGFLGALGAARLVSAQLYGHEALDLTTFALVPLILLGVAALAVWIPARRAAHVNPVVALRQE